MSDNPPSGPDPAPPRLPGPGLAKVRAAPWIRRRRAELVATSEGRLRELLEAADVVSEGSARAEGDDLVYYGSTSLLLMPAVAPHELAVLARILEMDPHVRLRVLRVARREACARAGGALGTLRAELCFGPAPAGARGAIALTADVTAVVLQRGARSSPA